MKYIITFITGLILSWYVLFEGHVSSFYYKQPVYFNFTKNVIESSVIESSIPTVQSTPVALIPTLQSSQPTQPMFILKYKYDASGSPVPLAAFSEVMNSVKDSWIKCGVEIEPYPVSSIYTENGNNNSNSDRFKIYWVDSTDFTGLTVAASSITNGVATISSYNIELSRKFYNLDNLRGTIIHEFGHVIGLPHSNDKKSIMYPTSNADSPILQPSDDDIANCKAVLKQLDIKSSQEIINQG